MVTSKNEGTPVSMIEAMACGIPFIAPHIGGIPDLAEPPFQRQGNLLIYQNGIIVYGYRVKDFIKAIQMLIDDGLRKKLGRTGRKVVRQKFSRQRLIKDIEQVYRATVSL
jgi:glycosyltransferase involved in cell wall biosynthesis